MKALLLGVSALCLAGLAVPAAAQEWNYGYGRGYSDNIRQHVRACRAHQRFHNALNREHADEHDDGFGDRDDHEDAHDALNDVHDEYHYENGGARNCGYWYDQYYRMIDNSNYGRRGYVYRGYNYPRSGYSFSWSSGY